MTNPLPRWRGFNLPEMFIGPDDLRWAEMIRNPKGAFVEDEFKWIADWGFDFVRLPLCYQWWASSDAPFEIDESALDPIDRAIEWARTAGLHVSLNIHHAPGYCINPAPVKDRIDLWKDSEALDCFCHHWKTFARRYDGLNSKLLDFDLLNEPAFCTREEYARVVRAAVETIRAHSPDRLIVIDGFNAGNEPCPELCDLKLAQSCRGYGPSELTHYLAWWAGYSYIAPAWPQKRADGSNFGSKELEDSFLPWKELLRNGTGVFCGEFGCNNRTPHRLTLIWMEELLGVLREMNVGWALWNLRGSFGVLDSGRSDVVYDNWHGVPLDRRMLELLQRM